MPNNPVNNYDYDAYFSNVLKEMFSTPEIRTLELFISSADEEMTKDTFPTVTLCGDWIDMTKRFSS